MPRSVLTVACLAFATLLPVFSTSQQAFADGLPGKISVRLRPGWNSISLIAKPDVAAIESDRRIECVVTFELTDSGVRRLAWRRDHGETHNEPFVTLPGPPKTVLESAKGKIVDETLSLDEIDAAKGYLIYVREDSRAEWPSLDLPIPHDGIRLDSLKPELKPRTWTFCGFPVGDYSTRSVYAVDSSAEEPNSEISVHALLGVSDNNVSIIYSQPTSIRTASGLDLSMEWLPESTVEKEDRFIRRYEAVWLKLDADSLASKAEIEWSFEVHNGLGGDKLDAKEPLIFDFDYKLQQANISVSVSRQSPFTCFQLSDFQWFFHNELLPNPDDAEFTNVQTEGGRNTKINTREMAEQSNQKRISDLAKLAIADGGLVKEGWVAISRLLEGKKTELDPLVPILDVDNEMTTLPRPGSRKDAPEYSTHLTLSTKRNGFVEDDKGLHTGILDPGVYIGVGKIFTSTMDANSTTASKTVVVIIQVPQIFGGYEGEFSAIALSNRTTSDPLTDFIERRRKKETTGSGVDVSLTFEELLDWFGPRPSDIETGKIPITLSILAEEDTAENSSGVEAVLLRERSFNVNSDVKLDTKLNIPIGKQFFDGLAVQLDESRKTFYFTSDADLIVDVNEVPILSQPDEWRSKPSGDVNGHMRNSTRDDVVVNRRLGILVQETSPGKLEGIYLDHLANAQIRKSVNATRGERLNLDPLGVHILGRVELTRVRGETIERGKRDDRIAKFNLSEQSQGDVRDASLIEKSDRAAPALQSSVQQGVAKIDSASQSFRNALQYLTRSDTAGEELTEQVANMEDQILQVALEHVVKNYRDVNLDRRGVSEFQGHFVDGIDEMFRFMDQSMEEYEIDRQHLQEFHSLLVRRTYLPGKVRKYEGGLRAFLEAELLLASQELLDALDQRFVKSNTGDGVIGVVREDARAKGRLFTYPVLQDSDPPLAKAAFIAGRSLRTWPLVGLDISVLGREALPLIPAPGGVGPQVGTQVVPIESLYCQIQDKRTQARLNAAKKVFNESSRERSDQEAVDAERERAEVMLQKTGFEAYLASAILGACHKDGSAFSRSGGGDLRTRIAIAARVHEMIRSGKQPDGYIKDFIPNRNPVEVFADAVSATISAIRKTKDAEDIEAWRLNSIGQIRAEITNQRHAFRDPLQQLSGLRFVVSPNTRIVLSDDSVLQFAHPVTGKDAELDPSNSQHREAFFRIIDDRVEEDFENHIAQIFSRVKSIGESIRDERDHKKAKRRIERELQTVDEIKIENLPLATLGMLGASAIEIKQAATRVAQSYLQLEQIVDRIEDERRTTKELNYVDNEALDQVQRTMKSHTARLKRKAMEEVLFSSLTLSQSVTVGGGGSGTTIGYSANPLKIPLAKTRGDQVQIAGSQNLELEGIRANEEQTKRLIGLERTIRELNRDAELAIKSVELALLELEQAKNNYASHRVKLESLVEEWAAAKDLAGLQFQGYAAQCVRRHISRIEADRALEDAVRACYLAAKAMQYVWVEPYSNPVTVMGTGTDVVLPKKEFGIFTRPESVLGAQNPDELKDFLEALYEWHKTLGSGLRGSPRGNETRFTKMISLRRDILGLDEFVITPRDDETGLEQRSKDRIGRFRDWLSERIHRERGRAEFLAFEFATEIDSDRMFSLDEWNQKIVRIGVNFRGNLPAASPTVSLTQSGTVSVRRFPPIFQNIERYSLSGYGLNDFNDVFDRPAEQRTYDKIAEVQINAARRDFLHSPENTMSAALIDMSVAADRWAFSMDFDDPANRLLDSTPFPVEALTDIEFILLYSFNHPTDSLSTQLQNEIKRLSTENLTPGGTQ